MVTKQNKTYALGYRAKGIKMYRSKIKPLGYLVAGLGFSCLAVAIIPNGLGFIMYPLGFSLLGLVGISTLNLERQIKDKLRFMFWRFRK